ncbi:hypothetical protein KSF_058370 [Reticulibacter mediterranei]|uniref:Uncharacterized protein n=1 Tax=Reticulibacter mediterranei TaxID=2778369 RepID=A0A8J3IHR8_9CHLR|nr:hypothetical protein KSF_058370 [Reticulibacter mediterranei]
MILGTINSTEAGIIGRYSPMKWIEGAVDLPYSSPQQNYVLHSVERSTLI